MSDKMIKVIEIDLMHKISGIELGDKYKFIRIDDKGLVEVELEGGDLYWFNENQVEYIIDEFKVGDRVRVIKIDHRDKNTKLKLGDVGTVSEVTSDSENIIVMFDRDIIELSDINMINNGYVMFKNQLEVIDEEYEDIKNYETLSESEIRVLDKYELYIKELEYRGFTNEQAFELLKISLDNI